MRVVFLSTLTAYNMTIIVPSMVHDQYGNWAYQDAAYTNALSKTNELSLGYMYSLYDGSNNFDDLDFSPYPAILDLELRKSQSYIFTNMPYSAKQTAIFNPGILYTQFASTAILSEFGGGGAAHPLVATQPRRARSPESPSASCPTPRSSTRISSTSSSRPRRPLTSSAAASTGTLTAT